MTYYDNMVSEVRIRINSLLKEKGITQNAVAAGDASAQKRLNSQLSHGATISLDTILRILDACPDVSAEWLLRGEGDMLKKELSASEQIASMPEERQLEMMDKMERLIGKLSDFTKLKEIYEENNRCLSELIAIEKIRK